MEIKARSDNWEISFIYMARRWTIGEEREKRRELRALYVNQNKTISEIGRILGIAESSVFDRMKRLRIASIPSKKLKYRNIRHDITIPQSFSVELAEFAGIMLGDGHISPTQVVVSFDSNELEYVGYVSNLASRLFGVQGRYIKRKNSAAYDLYIGSTVLVRFFRDMGLVSNKVQAQVDVPTWIKQNSTYQQAALRGLFDTDGSVYKLRFGFQMNFCNNSKPLLTSTRNMLIELGFHPSRISINKIYLTRISELQRYGCEIGFSNKKHLEKMRGFGIIPANGRFV